MFNKTTIYSYSVLGIIVLAATNVAYGQADIDELAAGVEKRIHSYVGLRFEYETTINAPSNKREIKTRNLFKSLPPLQENQTNDWRCWVQKTQRKKGIWEVARFDAWDGRQMRRYRGVPVEESAFNHGMIEPILLAHIFLENAFEETLFLDINGLPLLIDPSRSLQSDLDRGYSIERTEPFREENVSADTLYVLRGKWREDFGVEYEVHVTGAPEYLIHRMITRSTKGEGVYSDYRFESYDQFEGIAYPSRGVCIVSEMGEIKALNYRFLVNKVARLSETDRENWFPEWPRGTTLNNQIDNTVSTIPLEIKEFSRRDMEHLAQTQVMVEKSTRQRKWILYVNVAIVVAIISVLVWKKTKKA